MEAYPPEVGLYYSLGKNRVKMEDFNLKELFQYIISKIYIVLAITIAVVAGGFVYSNYIKTPLYRSTTKLVLTSEATSTTKITTSDVTLSNNLVKTYSEIIKSHDVLAHVIENLGLNMSVDQLAGKISVNSTNSTQLITVAVSDKDNFTAQKIANELSLVFKNEIIRLYKIDNVQIVDQASLAAAPYNVNKIKEIFTFFAVGLAFGLATVVIKFYLDNTIKNASTVEDRVGLVVLGVVPTVEKK